MFKEEITYLGHVISKDGVKTDPKKVAAVQECAIPLFVTDVRGFLGMCSYYRKFIKDFSNLTKPLNDLTKKESERCWRKEHTRAFNNLKEQLSSTAVLAFPIHGYTYILDTDASGFAIGGVLSQLQPKSLEGIEAELQKPVAVEDINEKEESVEQPATEGSVCFASASNEELTSARKKEVEVQQEHLLAALETRRSPQASKVAVEVESTRAQQPGDASVSTSPFTQHSYKSACVAHKGSERARGEHFKTSVKWQQLPESQRTRLLIQHEREQQLPARRLARTKGSTRLDEVKLNDRQRLCQLVRARFSQPVSGEVNSVTTSGECHESELELVKPKDTTGVEMVERPISYASRMLLPRELKYCARRREFLAIYELVQYFRHYLAGSKFIIRTDHDSLKAVKNLEKMTGQIARWIDYLEGFDFEIQVRKGKENANADFLSRIYTDCFCKEHGVFQQTQSAEEALASEPVQDWELFEACNKEMRDRRVRNKHLEIIKMEDPEALKLLTTEQLEWQLQLACKYPKEPSQQVEISAITKTTQTEIEGSAEISPIRTAGETGSEEGTSHAPGVPPQRVATMPAYWKKDELKDAQSSDEELGIIHRAKVTPEASKPTWNEISYESLGSKYYLNEWSRLRVKDGLLYREWESADGKEKRLQLVIPKKFQEKLIQYVHNTLTGAHQGQRKTLEFLRLRVFWYGMADQVKLFVKRCLVCQQTKVLNRPPRLGLQLYGAGFPNERIHVDYCGPMAKLTHENKYLFVVVDAFTKFTIAEPTTCMTARKAAEILHDRWVNVFGSPYQIHSDRGGSFTAGVFNEFCREMGMEHTLTTSYRPQANGQAERANRNIIEMLRGMMMEADDWHKRVSFVTAAYNFTPHSAHGFSPYFLMFGRHPYSLTDVRLPSQINGSIDPEYDCVKQILYNQSYAHQLARKRLKQAAEVCRRYYNRGGRVRVIHYEVGERVWLKVEYVPKVLGKFCDKFAGPYYIVSKWESGHYRIVSREGQMPQIVHHDRLRKYIEADPVANPRWVEDTISTFAKRTFSSQAQQVDDGDLDETSGSDSSTSASSDADSDEEEDVTGVKALNARTCSICQEPRFDQQGIFRAIDNSGKCHLCRSSKLEDN